MTLQGKKAFHDAAVARGRRAGPRVGVHRPRRRHARAPHERRAARDAVPIELLAPHCANFTGLVLGCIDADFASKYKIDLDSKYYNILLKLK